MRNLLTLTAAAAVVLSIGAGVSAPASAQSGYGAYSSNPYLYSRAVSYNYYDSYGNRFGIDRAGGNPGGPG